IIAAAGYLISIVGVAIQLYATPLYWKQPYHTSKLSGAEWVEELILGHPDRIWTELGMHVHTFLIFEHDTIGGLSDSRYGVTMKEQAAIFLY
ncbi:hypothetical protein DFP72DRAFT_757729, partial [Ephemerocybe angulata]